MTSANIGGLSEVERVSMPGFSYVTTLLGSATQGLETLDDLDVVHGASGVTLYATSRFGQSVTTLDLGAGVAQVSAQAALPVSLSALGGVELELLEMDGAMRAIALSPGAAALPSFAVRDAGDLGTTPDYLNGAGLGGSVRALATVHIGQQQFLFTAQAGQSGVTGYRVSGPDAVAAQAGSGAPANGSGAPSGITAMISADIGLKNFLFAVSDSANRVYSYEVASSGALLAKGSLGAAEGLGLNTPTALEQVQIDGKTFLLVAAAGSSSISVMQVNPDGGLSPTDHVVDDLTSRFQSITSLDTITIDGRAYVVAGGADDGLSLFTLLPNGRLLHLDSIEDQVNQSLNNVEAVALAHVAGQLQVFAGSATEAGLSQFTITLDRDGVEHTAPGIGARVEGTGAGDLLRGGVGNDDLRGGGGDDILMDGAGQDMLWGGGGRDIFVLSGDGEADQIRDFQSGLDTIDLSDWSMLRSVAQLDISSITNGGLIQYGDESLRLYSLDGSALSVTQIEAAVADSFLHHSVDFLTTDLSLTGTNLADVLRGRGGDDILLGGPGGDMLIGGIGQDTASYLGSVGVLTIDLLNPNNNTGVAQGDRYSSIEDVRGSASRDMIYGDHSANLLQGASSIDFLYGRGGDDELRGGMGQDYLFGGPGADLLKGGPMRDRAEYIDNPIGLVIDLGRPINNTGQAAGDRYDDIEDIGGTEHKDTISGDPGVNRLFGNAGADRLFGRGGDDELTGGSQKDWLDGGAGNDALRGGRQADTFVFREGRDTVLDFKAHQGDRIALDTDLWTNKMSATQVVSTFGTIVDGTVVLDFGLHELTLDGVTSLTGLAQDIVFV